MPIGLQRLGHSSSDDPTRYRDEAEVKAWEKKDPVDRFRAYLQKRGGDAATQARFELGYAPAGGDALLSTLGRDEAQRVLLDKVGLLAHAERGNTLEAMADLEAYLAHAEDGLDIDLIADRLSALRNANG